MLKTEVVGRGFNISRGAWQTFMHWKIMFDCCYCLNSTNHLIKFGINMALYFVTVLQSKSECTFFKYPSSWSESIKRFKLAASIRFDRNVSKMTRQGGCCTTVVVQNEIQNHQQKRKKAYLYIQQFPCRTTRIHFCTTCILQFLEVEILLHVFFHTYFTLSLAS